MKQDTDFYEMVFKDGYYEFYILFVCMFLGLIKFGFDIFGFVDVLALNGAFILLVIAKQLIKKLFKFNLKIRTISTIWLFLQLYVMYFWKCCKLLTDKTCLIKSLKSIFSSRRLGVVKKIG